MMAVPVMKHRALPIVAAMLLALACRSVPGRDVRFEPTPASVVRQMLELAGVGPQDVVFDLGSGDGRIPIAAARDFGARGVGIEIDPVLAARAEANARAAGVDDRVEFRVGDMYGADLRGATVVTLFLHPQPNLKLRPKLQRELAPGARIVSYMWDLGDWRPDVIRRSPLFRVYGVRVAPRRIDGIGGRRRRDRMRERICHVGQRSNAGFRHRMRATRARSLRGSSTR